MLAVAKVRMHGSSIVYAKPRVPFYLDTQFQTPQWCCEYMAGLVPPECKTILEPTPGLGNLVNALAGYEITGPQDFYSAIDPTSHFDCVVMNPPFSPPSLGYDILKRCMSMTDNIIALMPWLALINSDRRGKLINDYGLVSVTHLPRSTFRGARVQCCVLQMRRGYRGKTSLRFIWQPQNTMAT